MDKQADDTLRDDYDFSNDGTRGKYRHFSGQTHTLKIRHPVGSVAVKTIPFVIELVPKNESSAL